MKKRLLALGALLFVILALGLLLMWRDDSSGISRGDATSIKAAEPSSSSLAGPATPGTASPPVLSAGGMAVVTLPLQDPKVLTQAAKHQEAAGIYRFASAVPVYLTPDNSGIWRTSAAGKRIWHLGVSSPGAVSLNLGFQRYRMPEGGRMAVFPQGAGANSPAARTFTHKDNEEHGQLWTPLFEGGEIAIEVEVPARKEKELDLALTRVNHGFRKLAKVAEKIGDSATSGCEIDVVCGASTLPGLGPLIDAQRDQISAVGAFTLNGIDSCSGALINNTAGDGRPLFLTAHHCGVTPDNAPSMVTYWNFQNSTCRTPGCCGSDKAGDGMLNQYNTGAVFRAAYAISDFALVEMDDPVDPAAKAFFAGWDRSGAQAATSSCIHHPALAEKRISFSFNATTTTGWGGTTSPGDGSHARVTWTHGVTEPGSSGSPLFDQNLRIIGQLHGGNSACGGTGADWYGRISKSWDGGGTDSTRLKNWLDPLGTAPNTLDGRHPSAMLTVADASLVEGNADSSTMTFTVTLEPASSQTVTVNFNAASDIATIPSDLAAASGTLTFSPGQLTKTITISIISDTLPEADERFYVQLSNATNAGIYQAQASGIILNDDYLPPVIDSPLTAPAFAGRPFSYTIHGTNTPRTFALGGTPPAGMTVNAYTGIISWMPPAAGTYNVQIVASNPAGFDTKTLQIQASYGAADLSAGLPPVADQGALEASSAFAVSYYYKSFQEAKEHNWSLADPAHQFSPTFLLNQSNLVYGYTPTIEELLDLLAEHGCAPISLAPYTPADVGTWPPHETALAALPYRSAGHHAIGGGGTPELVDRMRAQLDSGDLCVFEFTLWRPDSNTHGTFENLNASNHHYNLPLPSEVVAGGLQAVAVVGYDDSQFDGRGGFKIVASFGTSWGDQGFAWVSYDFVKIFGYGVYVMEDRTGYMPTATARIQFDNSGDYVFSYDQITMTLGAGPESEPLWEKTIVDWQTLLREDFSADMVVDVSEAGELLPATENRKWWLKVMDNDSGYEEYLGNYVTVNRFEVNAGSSSQSAAAALPVAGSQVHASTFSVLLPAGGNTSSNYYVNDASTSGDIYTAGPGNPFNDGTSPATPKASIQQVIDSYVLKAGDIVWVDAGIYTGPTTINQLDRGSDGNPIRFIGVTLANGEPGTVLDRTGDTTGDVVSIRDNARCIQFENFWFKGGRYEINQDGSWRGSDAMKFKNVRMSGSSQYACNFFEASSIVFENCLIYGFGSSYDGLNISRSSITFDHSTIHAPVGRRCAIMTSSSSDYASNAYLMLSDSILFGQKTSPTGPAIELVYVGNYSSVSVATRNVLNAAHGATIGFTPDASNVLADPLFANAAGGDYHEQSTAGRWDPSASGGAGAWVVDAADSPAIDAGNFVQGVGSEPAPNGGRVNAGAFGGTAFASKSALSRRYLITTGPSASSIHHSSATITWSSPGDGWLPGDTVRIEYTTDGGGNWTTIPGASALVYNVGSFVWSLAGIPYGTAYQVRVVSNADGLVSSASPGTFSVEYPVFYYVNDASQTGDVYTTAVGSAANNGLSAATPKDSVQAILDAYDLKGGDIIYVDTGTFALSTSLTIGSNDSGDTADRVRIVGSTTWGGTVLDRNNPPGSYDNTVSLTGCSYVRLENLWITRGVRGVYFLSAPDCQIVRCRVSNASTGIDAGTGANNLLVDHCIIDQNNDIGVNLYRSGHATLTNNTICYNGGNQFDVTAWSSSQSVISQVTLRNNILRSHAPGRWCINHTVGAGAYSLVLTSDYNVLFAAGTSGVATNGSSLSGFGGWQVSTGQDRHSLSVDPLFVDADGPDNIAGNADDDFHLQSTAGSWHGGAFTADTGDSPAIDSGDPSAPVGPESAPNGNRVNLGAFGGTTQASRTPAGRVLALVSPNGGEIRSGIHDIRWQTSGLGWSVGDTVKLEYSPDNGATWQAITGAAALTYDAGSFLWNSAIVGSSAVARVRVTSNQNGSVVDGSDGTFLLHNGSIAYYVNDASQTGDVYTAAAGNVANDGLSTATPKDSVQAILDAYDLEGGDVINVDSGNYLLTSTLTVSSADGGDATNPVRIVGSTTSGSTVLDRNNTGSDVLSLSGSKYVSLENLWITRGNTGIFLSNAPNCKIIGCRLYNNNYRGIYFGSYSDYGLVDHCLIDRNGSAGVTMSYSDFVAVNGSTVFGHGYYEIYLPGNSSVDSTSLRNNIILSDGAGKYGVYVGNYAFLSASDYNDLRATNGASVGYYNTTVHAALSDWQTATGNDARSLSVDPLFVDADGPDNIAGNTDDDFHLQSTAGSWHGGAFTADVGDSPAIDSGDPATPVGAESAPNGNRVNLGAFGGTAQASRTPAGRVLALISPNGSEVRAGAYEIRWQTSGLGWSMGDSVKLEYSLDNGASWQAITGAAALAYDAGSFLWNSTIVGSSAVARVRVTSNQNGSVVDGSDGTFLLHNGSIAYYVNDASQTGDVYTAAAGNVANDGLSTATPKDSIQAILNAYNLEAGDIIYVDTGAYALSATLMVSSGDSGDASSPVRIVGSTTWGGTVLDRNSTGNDAVFLSGCSHVWLESLWITRGQTGVSVSAGAQNCKVLGCRIYKNSSTGIYLTAYGYGAVMSSTVEHCLIDRNGNYGVNCYYAGNVSILNCTLMGHTTSEVTLGYSTHTFALRNSSIWADGNGRRAVYVDSGASLAATTDYNDLRVTNGAVVGYFNSASQATLADWQTATGKDAHSLSNDPLFVDADGADNIAGNADDDFHLQSTAGSWHGGTFTADATDSPAIDAGDPSTPVGAESAPNGNRINLGAFGGTAQASRSVATLVLLAPSAGSTSVAQVSIQWLATWPGLLPTDTVNLQYSTDGSNWLPIPGGSAVAANAGQFVWNVAGLAYGTTYRVRVVSNQPPLVTAESGVFSLGGSYYVNDNSTADDVFTTAPGNDANDGMTPATPKASLEAILSAYDLRPGDLVLMDAGTYSPASALTIDAADGGAAGSPVRIRGVKGKTLINQGINLGASFVSLEDLRIRTAVNGVYVTGGNCAVMGCQISECSASAIYVWQADGTTIKNNTLLHSGTDGAIYLRAYYYQGYYGLIATIRNNTIVTTGATGIYARVSAGPVITNNIISVKGTNRYAMDASPQYYSITLTSDYNVLHATDGAQIGNYYGQFQTASLDQWKALIGWELHSIAADPQFANAAAGDYHVKSRGGRFDPSLGLPVNNPAAWVTDSTTSPAVDGGDPGTSVGAETAFNGGRINAGADGGTDEASRSVNAGRNVEIISPVGGAVLEGYARVEWRTSGADWQTGDTLRLEYSQDGGLNWLPVSGAATLPWTTTQFYWDTTEVANGYGYLLRAVHVQSSSIIGVPTALFAISNGAGADWNLYVAPSGVDDALHGTQAMPFKTIGYAINMAQGQTGTHVNIHVAAGTYTGNVILKSYVNLLGGYSAADWSRNIAANVTTLDAQGSGTVVTGANDALIEGFTITGGSASHGAGIYCNSASPVIRYCRIVNNISTSGGGGIYGSSSSPTIVSCLIANNQAQSGYGDGIELSVSNASIRNCTVINNGGLGIRTYNGGTVRVANSIIWNNGDDISGPVISYSNIEDSDTGTGVIHLNPLLDANFRLTGNSPCINQGANLEAYQMWLDIDGQQRVRHGIVDMGAHEFDQLVAFPLAATINEDTPVSGTLTGSDVNGGVITFAKVASPAKGVAIVNADGSYTYTPNLDANGADSFTFKVNNGTTDSNEAMVSITITPVNDAPTVADIADLSINEDTNTGAIPFTIGDAETVATSLTVTRSSSNTTLVPTANVVLGGSGANRTITVTPVANLSGTATITVTVSDGPLTMSDTFMVTVNAVNDPPTISNITNRTINEDANTGAVAFTVADIDTPVASLVMTGSSSNTALVPDANITFGGNDASRTVTVTPAPNQNGTSTITVTVSDGAASPFDTFLLTVSAVNDAPTISDIPDTTINEDTNTGALAFAVGDLETAATSLTVTRSSSNTTLVPTANVVLGGSGANRTVTVTPVANLSGTATITMTVSDGTTTTSDTFLLTVNAVNDPPTISNITNRTINEDANTGAVAFTIGDIDTPATSLIPTGSSSNVVLVPDANIVFGGSGTNRTVTVTPAADKNGTATITVMINDGTNTVSDTFLLTVNAVNDAPVAEAQSVTMPGETAREITLTGSDVDLNPLTFSITTMPAHGTLSGTPPVMSYLPNAGYAGPDSFTFRVDDGLLNSTAAQVSINISAVAPVITAGPTDGVFNPGAMVTLTAAYTGTNPVTYQWRKNEIAIPTATSATLNFASIAETDEGSYDVVITNSVDSATSSAAVLSVNDPVTFVSVPVAKTVSEMDEVHFNVAAVGTGMLTYQWRKDNTPIPLATGNSFTIASAGTGDGGLYDVQVTNIVGTVTTTAVLLRVIGGQPEIIVQPLPRIASTGTNVTLEVTALGRPPLKYQWKRNGTNVAGATTRILALNNLQLSQAGVYTVVVTVTGSVTSAGAQLTVVENIPKTTALPAGSKITMTVKTAGADVIPKWHKNGAMLMANQRYSISADGKTFIINNLSAVDDSAIYTCEVTGPGGAATGATLDLRVFDKAPDISPLASGDALPPGIVSGTYFYQIPVLPDTDRAPSAYAASGLPTGLKLDTKTGVISGKPTVSKSMPYALKLTASNSMGKDSVDVMLHISTLPAGSVGVFAGPIPRAALNGHLGGRLDLTTTVSGGFSGKVTLGSATAHIFSAGVLDVWLTTGNNPQGSMMIKRTAPLPPLLLTFTLDPAQNRISSARVSDGSQQVDFAGWRNVWNATSNKADKYDGYYTFGLELPPGSVGDAVIPQGLGYASFNVAPAGTLTLTGRTADGETMSGAAFVGPLGEVLVFQPLYRTTPKGSLVGSLLIGEGASASNDTDNTLGGTVSWSRPASNAREYSNGFGPLDMAVMGGRYLPPPKDVIVLGLAAGPGNAKLLFTRADIETAVKNPDVVFELTKTHASKLPLAGSSGNPAKVSFTVNPTTGSFIGKFTLVDPHPVSGAIVTRPDVQYQGLIYQSTAGFKAGGWFMLPGLPQTPGQTSAMTPIQSGHVSLKAPE